MTHLPDSLVPQLKAVLAALGDTSTLAGGHLLSGGCINKAMRLETEQRRYFLKWNAAPLPGMFTFEARGLAALAETKTVHVPAVLHVAEQTGEHPAFILLEWVEGAGGDLAVLGEQLARLHQVLPEHGEDPSCFGLGYANYHGSSPQQNTWNAGWVDFFIQSRLLPQAGMAQRNGYLNSWRKTALQRLIERLPTLFAGGSFRPSLIHGDLWSGNILPSAAGLTLVDPAISYSDREAEIAYTQMFGSFEPRFYQGYQSVWPLDPGYDERRPLHNLYHLLNHLNIFGEEYGPHVDAVLRRYTQRSV